MAGQQYDQYGNPYDPNDPYAQHDPNDPYSSQYVHEPYPTEYVGNDPNAAEYVEGNPYAEPVVPEYHQVPEYEEQVGMFPERREEPAKGPSRGNEDYYVSLEPCGRGSSCSMLDSADPKCMIRLVGKGYKKEIELSLDKKMDSLIYRIFRCLEDEGIVLDGIRLQGLPKKNCLQACLEALCAPFVALSSISARPPCCRPVQYCCCTPGISPMRSSIISHRRSTLSARGSMDSRRPSVRNTRPRRSKNPKRRKSTCNPCRMARVCQGPKKEDCVLIKISPSLPKVGSVQCKKRSTGVGTDKFPELEILLQGGKKKCTTKKHRGCPCPHCCEGGKMKIIKCRARQPKPCRSPAKEKKEPFDPKALDAMSEEELVKMLENLEAESPSTAEHYDPEVLDAMTEEELIDELQRLEKGPRDARLSFSQRPNVNITLVESSHSLNGNGNFLGSGSRLVLPKKGCAGADSLKPKQFHRDLKYDAPLKVFPVHQTKNGPFQALSSPNCSTAEGYNKPKKRRENGSTETAMVLKEVLCMMKEILKSRNKSDDPQVQTIEEKPGETSPKCPPPRDEVNAIFRRSDIWMSESDASHPGALDQGPSVPPKPQLLRNFVSSKSINVVACLKKPFRSKRSFRKHRKPKFEPPGEDHKDGENDKFELRIYVETDKKGESAEFSPIELTEKKGSTNLNTLIA